MTAIAPGAPRKSRLPRHEGEWRGREESPVPAFRLDVPAPTPDSSPCASSRIIQRCDAPEDECGVFCIFDATGYIPDVPGECPLCRSTGIKYIFEQDFLAEPDRDKHVWFTWEQLGGDSPTWVIGNLDGLDWSDADPSWSHEEPQEQPEQPEEEYEEEPLDDQEEVDEQELHNDLYDGDGEHNEDFLE